MTNNYINHNKFVNKYEVTNIIEDNDFMDSNFREILKDRSPDPSREYELARKPSTTNGILAGRYGRSTDKDMYIPDLFLGDMSKDPRSIMDGPDLNGIRKFMKHRAPGYVANMLNDDDVRINSKIMTHANVKDAKDEMFKRVKKKYTNFSEQSLNAARSVKNFKTKPTTDFSKQSHKENYNNKESTGKQSHAQNVFKNISDYSIKSKESKKTVAKKTNKSKVDLRLDDIDHKKKNEITQDIAKLHALTISNFIDRKLESLDDYKLSAATNESESQTVKKQIVQSLPSKEEIEYERKPAIERLIYNRISRNSDLFNTLRDDPESLSHKTRLNEILAKTSRTVRETIIDNTKTLVTSKKLNSVEANNSKAPEMPNNDSKIEVSKISAKNKGDLVIYNYKTKRPERVIQASEKSETIETYTNRNTGNKKTVSKYDQIRESYLEDNQTPENKESRQAGLSGPMGSKYLRPSLIFREPTEDNQLIGNLRASHSNLNTR